MLAREESESRLISEVSVGGLSRLAVPGFPSVEDMLAGGFVPGSVTLLHGGPGVGKSTLAFQWCDAVAKLNTVGPVPHYIASEQMLEHVKLMAVRIGLAHAPIRVAYSIDVDEVCTLLETWSPPFAVVDSLQNLHLYRDVRGAEPVVVCAELVHVARAKSIALVLICHETKDGDYAGPRTLEHLVDCMISLELPSDDEEDKAPSSLLKLTVHGKYRFGSVPRIAYVRRDEEGKFYGYTRDITDPG